MTKQELLTEFENLPFVAEIGEPELVETKQTGTKVYTVPFMDAVNDCAIYRSKVFYVRDEGGGLEEAFYHSSFPQSQIQVQS